MSKAYLLAICLLATTLTGCLADDNETTEQKISPVGDEGDQNGGNETVSDSDTIMMRYGHYNNNHFANFSRDNKVVQVNFSEPFSAFVSFYDVNGIEIKRNTIQNSFDRCHSNGNWTAYDIDNSTHTVCYEQYAEDAESVIWEITLARTPMSVAIGDDSYYYLESF